MVMVVKSQPAGIAVLPIGRQGDPGIGLPGNDGADGAPGEPGGSLAAFRPGDHPEMFTGDLVGARGVTLPLDPAGAVRGTYRITGAGILATRSVVWLEPNAFFAIRVGFMRLRNPSDPNNDAIRVGVQWLSADYAAIGQSTIKQVSGATELAGLQQVMARVPSLRADLPGIKPPAGAVFWRPFIQTYGLDGLTSVWALVTQDVTNTGVYAPDVAALEARISAMESLLDAGLPLSAPILPSYTVAALPAPGNRGRKAFALDGRAPDAAGVLEPANAGTGVEVTDNGTAWKIAGTNQTVQA